MKDIPKWLAESLSKLRKPFEDDRPSNADPDENDLPKDVQGFVTDAPMPDIYADECAVTVPRLKVLDLDLTDVDESPGIDPYNTGILQKK